MRLFLCCALALCTALSAAAGTEWMLGNDRAAVDTLYHIDIGSGMTTTALRVSIGSSATNIYYTTVDLENPNIEIRAVAANDGNFRSESVKSMGERMNTLGRGRYMAGINGDFFGEYADGAHSISSSVVDGHLIDARNDRDWDVWATYLVVYSGTDLEIRQGVSATKALCTADGRRYRCLIDTRRNDDELIVYTQAYGETTKTNIWGSECAVRVLSGDFLRNTAVLEVVSAPTAIGSATAGNSAIPADGMILSGHGAACSFVAQLRPGDRLSLSQSVVIDGRECEPEHIIGGCSYTVVDGHIADDANLTVEPHFASAQARTTIGYDRDRSRLIMLVADKYTENLYTTGEYAAFQPSTGLTVKRMGQIMLALGCHTTMNCDGGGSSQLWNRGLGMRNVPYGLDGYLRPVANAIFAVDISESGVIDTPTAINDILPNPDTTPYSPPTYYNLQGIPVTSPSPGQIYITNSEKIIIGH